MHLAYDVVSAIVCIVARTCARLSEVVMENVPGKGGGKEGQ